MKVELENGALYRVIYKSQTGNGRWSLREMKAIYLGRGIGESMWSLRPLAGTALLSNRYDSIEKVELLIDAKGIDRLGGVRSSSLPVARPRSLGYCEPPKEFQK